MKMIQKTKCGCGGTVKMVSIVDDEDHTKIIKWLFSCYDCPIIATIATKKCPDQNEAMKIFNIAVRNDNTIKHSEL